VLKFINYSIDVSFWILNWDIIIWGKRIFLLSFIEFINYDESVYGNKLTSVN